MDVRWLKIGKWLLEKKLLMKCMSIFIVLEVS